MQRLAILAAALLFGFLQRPEALAQSGPVTILRMSSGATQVDPYQIGLERFRDLVQAGSNGALKVELFPNGQLGEEGSVLKSIQSGTIAGAPLGNANVADLLPAMHLFDLPFLLRDREQAYRVLDGPTGKIFAKDLEAKGLVLLGYYEAGVRNIINNQRPLNSLEDFKGLKIRVLPSAINIDTFRALGANPVPLPYGQIYTALQTKTVDGAEASSTNYVNNKFYEVAPNFARVRWQIFVAPVVFSKRIFDRLTPDQQALVRSALEQSVEVERKAYLASEEGSTKEMLARGVVVTEPPREPWIEAVKPVWAKWAPIVGQGNIDAVMETRERMFRSHALTAHPLALCFSSTTSSQAITLGRKVL